IARLALGGREAFEDAEAPLDDARLDRPHRQPQTLRRLDGAAMRAAVDRVEPRAIEYDPPERFALRRRQRVVRRIEAADDIGVGEPVAQTIEAHRTITFDPIRLPYQT